MWKFAKRCFPKFKFQRVWKLFQHPFRNPLVISIQVLLLLFIMCFTFLTWVPFRNSCFQNRSPVSEQSRSWSYVRVSHLPIFIRRFIISRIRRDFYGFIWFGLMRLNGLCKQRQECTILSSGADSNYYLRRFRIQSISFTIKGQIRTTR